MPLFFQILPSSQQVFPIVQLIKYDQSKYFFQMEKDLPKPMQFTPLHQHPQWEPDIQKQLLRLAGEKELSGKDAIEVLLDFRNKYCFKREPPKLPRWKKEKIVHLEVLFKIYQDELGVLIKRLTFFLLEYIPGPIPLLLTGETVMNQYSKKKLFYLVVLMFMGLVPRQPYDTQEFRGRFSSNNDFGHLLSYSQFKTRCVVEYLKDTLPLIMKGEKAEEFLIQRRSSSKNLFKLIQDRGELHLSNLIIASDTTSIEEFDGDAKVDFANRFIGGGCLRDGCVQEEIMFAIRPQLYTATLLCEKMEYNESLAFRGFRYYFKYNGYSNKTRYDGKIEHPSKPFQHNGFLFYDEKIVAIDALKFGKEDYDQFSEKCINRQLLKSFTGFSCVDKGVKVVTGGWGCGVYNGDFVLKVIIQWIAASMAERDIVICPFGRKRSLEQINFVQRLKHLKIKQLYSLVLDAGAEKQKYNLKKGVFQLIMQKLQKP